MSLGTSGPSQPASTFEEDLGMGYVGRVREVEEMEKKGKKRDKWELDSLSFQIRCHGHGENLFSTLSPHNRIIPKTFQAREMLFSFKSVFRVHKDQNFLL